MPDYFEYLGKEIVSFANKFKDYTVSTIYIGGGTPSFVSPEFIAKTLSKIKENFEVSKDAEISIEANPNSISPEKAKIWKEAGVNRVSVGLQSASKKLLKTIGRIHTLKDYKNAIKTLKEAGFSNINTDIMIGLPKQDLFDVRKAIRIAAKDSTHISAYSLILEEGTPLYKMVQAKELNLPSEELAVEMYDIAFDKLEKAGFKRYEVSNFAKEGYACKHNLNCWGYLPYIGFGAGAHSFVENRRCENVAGIGEYIARMEKYEDPTINKTELNREEQLEEYVMLGMRKAEGISPEDMKKLFNYDILKQKATEINRLKNAGFIEVSDRIKATEMGFFVLNKIILELV